MRGPREQRARPNPDAQVVSFGRNRKESCWRDGCSVVADTALGLCSFHLDEVRHAAREQGQARPMAPKCDLARREDKASGAG